VTGALVHEGPRSAGEPGAERLKVVYIGGMGRSGSTLLDLMLGQLPGVCSVGELRYVWLRGLTENVLCSCGQPFRECPFWQAVAEEAFGGWDALDLDEVLDLEHRVDRHRFLPFMLAPGLAPGFAERLERYTSILERLYGAIRNVTGASVIVDSTKDPPYAYLLRHVDSLDLYLVHLVRDIRGVAFSWMKKNVVRPEVADGETYMKTFHPAEMALRWIDYNVLFERLGKTVPSLRMRYESFIERPEEHLTSILALVGASTNGQGFADLENGHFRLAGEHHNVSGNPVRFRNGALPLRVDDEWKRKLSPRDRRIIVALTWPLLRRYGYLGNGSA